MMAATNRTDFKAELKSRKPGDSFSVYPKISGALSTNSKEKTNIA